MPAPMAAFREVNMWDLPFLSNIWTPAPWRNVMPWQVVRVTREMSRYIFTEEGTKKPIGPQGVHVLVSGYS